MFKVKLAEQPDSQPGRLERIDPLAPCLVGRDRLGRSELAGKIDSMPVVLGEALIPGLPVPIRWPFHVRKPYTFLYIF
jgi:hypothetical protein